MSLATLDLGVVYALLFVSLYFEVFLLTSVIERWSRKPKKRGAGARPIVPTVAIVVPCYNEERTIEATVRSLLALDYPKEKLELYIIDDGSSDRTLEVAHRFAANAIVRIFHKENGGKHTAMNLALAHTKAELIGCLDADSVVAPSALKEMVAIFSDEKIAAATPGIHVKEPRTLLQHLQQVEYRLALFNRFALAALGSAFITPGPFSLFRSDAVRKLGGWRHGHATEDMEMALRVQEAGYLIANVPGAVVHTTTPRTLRALYRQRVRWTYGWLRNALDYRYMFGSLRFGNLGLVVLPTAIISIFAGIYFFARVVYFATRSLVDIALRTYATGIYPHPSFDLFYLNTSVLWFLVYLAVLLIIALLCAGTVIGTERGRLPPKATPLFLLFYSFLVPLWLGTAVVRAFFKTGVRWR